MSLGMSSKQGEFPHEHVVMVNLSGELSDLKKPEIMKLSTPERHYGDSVAIDMSGVSHIGQRSVGALGLLSSRVQEEGGGFTLFGLSYSLEKQVKAHQVESRIKPFDIRPNKNVALAYLSSFAPDLSGSNSTSARLSQLDA